MKTEMFRVPQREVQVTILLQGGQELRGHLYAAASGPGGGPARLIDRLNDRNERFLPLTEGGRGRLLSKDWIVKVDVAEDEQALELDGQADSSRIAVRFAMGAGAPIDGLLRYAMPPDKGRLLDYLNAAERFIPLLHEGGASWVNRDYIAAVTSHADEPPGSV